MRVFARKIYLVVSSVVIVVAMASLPVIVPVAVSVMIAPPVVAAIAVIPAAVRPLVSSLHLRLLAAILFFLPFLVMHKIIKNRSRMSVRMDDSQNLNSFSVRYLLSVSRISNRLIFIIFQTNMPQLHIRDILNINPAHLKLSLPLILRPHRAISVVVHVRNHLGHSTEMSGTVNRKEQKNRTIRFAFMKSLVEALVAVLGAAPNLVFDAAMNVVFRVRFYNEKTGARCGNVEVRGIVVVLAAQFVEDGMRRSWGRHHDSHRAVRHQTLNVASGRHAHRRR